MRLLVQCPQCKRQYDASGRSVGSRFRCHCGRLVEVQQPHGHDARVVHCSACGAARTEKSDVCPYCQAEFTLHERDLNTVCPNCLARVSDSARFCHHCGTGLTPELDAGKHSELVCPACADKHRLVSRRVGREQVTVLECGRCGGFWLGHEAFRQLVERAVHEALPFGTQPLPVAGSAGKGLQQRPSGRFYRPCPVCGELMNRFNYGRVSGVVIDACKEHGIWFDGDALSRILEWIHEGGTQVTARAEELYQQEKIRHAEELHRLEKESEVFASQHPPRHFLDTLLAAFATHRRQSEEPVVIWKRIRHS
jgi:Zn-finger nucleic acid-binding protein